VLDFPVNLSGSFFQRQQDSIYVRRVAGLRAELMFSDVFSAGGTLQQENIIPSTTIASQAVSNSRTLTAGVTLQYDSRDDIVAPTSGIHYVTDYLIGSKKIYSAPGPIAQHNSTVQKVSVDAELYVQPIERQVVALGMHGRQLTSDNIEVSDRFRFGGTNTLRGFRENQFIGSRVAWTNAEYRFMTGIRTFFYGFFDTGYYFLPGDDQLGQPSVQHVTYGYGVGVRVQTVIGNIGVSIALGEGDAFSEAKLHVGLMNSF
jgi:outer membrane protein insertion porin family